MSLKKNAAANFAGQLYRASIGIVMLPMYMQFLGEESYGLVAFFSLLNSWLVLLTASVAPTLARQVAYARGRNELGGRQFREMLRSLEVILVGIGIAIMLFGWMGSAWVATHWLTVTTIHLEDVAYCISLMFIIIGLSPGSAMYSSGISGLERQVWLNGFNIGFSTLRFGMGYVLLRWVSNDVVHYFEFQLLVSLLELAFISRKFYACQPPDARQQDPGLTFSWPAVRSIMPFTMGIAYTSMLWVLMTQSDKLVLSHVLSLSEFGYFGIVVLLANGVLLFSAPINKAVLPRLTLHHSHHDKTSLLELYRTTTQFLAVIVFSVSGILAAYSQPVIFALTGNQTAAQWGAPVLTWFAMGNAILVIAGMQYSLQFAHGHIRLHVINTTINAIIQVPILVYVAVNHGAVAVAKAWFLIRIATFFVWPAIVHHKYAPGLHWKWILFDVLPPLLGVALGVTVIESWGVSAATLNALDSRLMTVSLLFACGTGTLLVSALFAREVRARAAQQLRALYNRFV